MGDLVDLGAHRTAQKEDDDGGFDWLVCEGCGANAFFISLPHYVCIGCGGTQVIEFEFEIELDGSGDAEADLPDRSA